MLQTSESHTTLPLKKGPKESKRKIISSVMNMPSELVALSDCKDKIEEKKTTLGERLQRGILRKIREAQEAMAKGVIIQTIDYKTKEQLEKEQIRSLED